MAWYVEGGGLYNINGEKIWGRNFFVLEEDSEKIRDRFKNVEAYCTCYKYEDKEDPINTNKLGNFIVDLDIHINSEYDYNKLKMDLGLILTELNLNFKVPFPLMRLYFSGNKGFHIEIPYEVFGIKPDKRLHEKYKALGTHLRSMTSYKTLDLKIYECRRLIRMANSINGETGLHKVPVEYDFIKKSTYEDMKQYASSEKYLEFSEPYTVPDAELKFNEFLKKHTKEEFVRLNSTGVNVAYKGDYPPCIKEILERGAVSGQRNSTAFALASAILQRGVSLDEATNQILDWNREKNVPPSPEGEIIRTVHSANVGIVSGRRYGCGGIESLGLCIPENCSVKAKKTQAVQTKPNGKKAGGFKGGRRKQIIQ